MAILIVEDEPVTRSLLEGILKNAGYEILTASSVRAAIAHLESDSGIEVIISDIMLPDRDGLVFVNSLRWDRRFNKMPVLICSSLNDSRTVQRSAALGVVDYVIKPIRSETLLEKVAKARTRCIPPVLLVSDDSTALDHLERTLRRNGFTSIKALSTKEAMAQIRKDKVAAVITSPFVSSMSGFDLLVEVKALDSSIPVLVITDHNGIAAKRDVMSEGADGFIVRPFSNLDLVSRLEHCIKRSMASRVH